MRSLGVAEIAGNGFLIRASAGEARCEMLLNARSLMSNIFLSKSLMLVVLSLYKLSEGVIGPCGDLYVELTAPFYCGDVDLV